MSKEELRSLRIIGGRWRSRKIHFTPYPGLRPTPNRVRETLFNWLMPIIMDANCLDLFAGSGALGFEALSRGAASVVMVDESVKVIEQLKKNAEVLGATNQITFCCRNVNADLTFLPDKPYDIIFLDPPFQQNWIVLLAEWLEKNSCLKLGTYIYIEAEATLQPLPIPAQWEILRSKKAGGVGYYLLRRI